MFLIFFFVQLFLINLVLETRTLFVLFLLCLFGFVDVFFYLFVNSVYAILKVFNADAHSAHQFGNLLASEEHEHNDENKNQFGCSEASNKEQ